MKTRYVFIGREEKDPRRATVLWQDNDEVIESALMIIECRGSVVLQQGDDTVIIMTEAIPELCRQLRESAKRSGAA